MTTHSSVLAWKSQEQRSLVGCTVHEVVKESNMTEQLNNNLMSIFTSKKIEWQVSHQTAKKNCQFNDSWTI